MGPWFVTRKRYFVRQVYVKNSIEFSFTNEITGPAQNEPGRQSRLLPSEIWILYEGFFPPFSFQFHHRKLKWNGWETFFKGFLLAILDLTVHNVQSMTNRNIALIYSVIICEQKTKDCVGWGSFQHNLQHRCFQLWCLPGFLTSLLYKLWFHFDQATCNVNKSGASASRNSSQNAGNHENLYSIRRVKSNIQLSTVSLNKITKSYKKDL